MVNVSIVGGSGYGGGELLRLLLSHPNVEVKQATSHSHLGEYVYQVHPNLRKRTQLKFSDPGQIDPVDVLFLALPHGEAQKQIARYASLAGKIVDLSADFRLRSPADYEKWYGASHSAPEWLSKFVYGPGIAPCRPCRCILRERRWLQRDRKQPCIAAAGQVRPDRSIHARHHRSEGRLVRIGSRRKCRITPCGARQCDPDFFGVRSPPYS